MTNTIDELLKMGAASDIAIVAPDRPPLTYEGLRAHVGETAAQLNALGVGSNDRVAIVLPNGPEMASAFLSIASAATTAPLNPAYRQEEFSFYLSDLNAKALLVDSGSESPAVAAANELGIPVFELAHADTDPAGKFKLSGQPAGPAVKSGPATGDEIGMVLHTSGTTSRPKIVPLSQKNLCASAGHIGRTLALTPQDRCLNIMPLFHIHGLMAAVLASIAAGASVYCTPGFNALRVFAWMDDAEPTWYTAVPTMHQTILARAGRNRDIIERRKLRFIRSSSASLPPAVMRELEEVFQAPVIESYGMTEAAHQMASNLLPPGDRKPGTVGVAAGPEVGIMDLDGTLLATGQIGEIVIRGPNVTAGYENNPEANATAFTNGWFHTGDQGTLDADGYLSITGRLKEIINRGGEKIAPLEVDNIIQEHPAVAQVLTFAMPHRSLGEEVAAAVVLQDGETATEQEIRDFTAKHLADFKVPRRIIFLDEIPKGATGKLQRIGLAEKLGLAE
jgi:acyl-CoA synthetase (AMP-forming)/AMP-acid ligase II